MKKNLFLSFCICFVLICIISSPQKYISVALNAIDVWAKILVPALFPFFVFTKLLTSFGYAERVSLLFQKTTYKFYKTPPISAYVFLMSILTGYPVGSKLVSDLYNNGQISKQDAKKIITFTSNSGPMFIIGSVGIGMLTSKSAGYIILLSHIIGALINGLFYRNIKIDNSYTPKNYNLSKQDTSLSSSVFDSIQSILMIGGIVVIAFIFIEILNDINIFSPIINLLKFVGINPSISSSIINGLCEITRGCLDISNLALSTNLKTIFACFIISFGGISTTLQAMAFLKNIVSYKFFIGQKITHMICSTITCAILTTVFI